jgi:hypothetical protein
MENIRVLIDYCFGAPEDEEKKRVWHNFCHSYCDAMEILSLWREYTDADIERFQEKMDVFFSCMLSILVLVRKG